MLVRASGIEDILVGSDVRNNANLKVEMYVYKANDADPNYDYLFIRLHVEKWAYRGDNWVGIEQLSVIISCYASGAVSLEIYREPDPGTYWTQSQVSVTYYGFGITVLIPAGVVEYSTNGNHVGWSCYKLPFWWAPPVTIHGADFTIGFRTTENAAASIIAHSLAFFYHTFWGIPLGGGSGPDVAVYVPYGA